MQAYPGAQLLFAGHLRSPAASDAVHGQQHAQKQRKDVIEIAFDRYAIVQGVHVVPRGVVPHPDVLSEFVGASDPAAFRVEICARDASQPETVVLRPLQSTDVHGGRNVPIAPQDQFPTNYVTVSGTFETASLILYGQLLPPEHVSPLMAAAMASNPPALPDEQQLLADLQGGPESEEDDATTTTANGEFAGVEWLRPSANRVLESAKLCQPQFAEFCELSGGPESKHFLVSSALAHQVANYVADKSVMVLSVMPAAQCSEMFNGLSQLLRACWETDPQGSTGAVPSWPVHMAFSETLCQQLRDIAIWGINQLSVLDDVNDHDANERVQRYLNCGLASLELCEMMLVNEYTAHVLTAGGDWLKAVLRPLKTQSLPRHGVDKVLRCLFLCTQHYDLLTELFDNIQSKGLSVYEIVVQEMAERTLRGEIAELGRHILQKAALVRSVSNLRHKLMNCQRTVKKCRRTHHSDAAVGKRCHELDEALSTFSAVFLALLSDNRAKGLRLLRTPSPLERFFLVGCSDRCLARVVLRAGQPQLFMSCAAVIESAGALIGVSRADNDAWCALVSVKKSLARGLATLSMLPIEHFAATSTRAFEAVLRCAASDPARVLLTADLPSRSALVRLDHRFAPSVEAEAAALVLEALGQRSTLALVQAATTGDHSLVAGCIHALQTLHDMLSFPNGRTAVARALDVRTLQSIIWLSTAKFCGAQCDPYLAELCQLVSEAPSPAVAHAVFDSPAVMWQVLQAHPNPQLEEVLRAVHATIGQQSPSADLPARISAMFHAHHRIVVDALVANGQPSGRFASSVDVHVLTIAVLGITHMLPASSEARQQFAEGMILPCLTLGKQLCDAIMRDRYSVGEASHLLNELAMGTVTEEGAGVEHRARLVVAIANAVLTMCGVMMTARQLLPLLDPLVDFALKTYHLGYYMALDEEPATRTCPLAAELKDHAFSVLKMFCPPSPMASTALVVPRLAAEGLSNLSSRILVLELASLLLPDLDTLTRSVDCMDYTLLSRSQQLAEVHQQELRQQADHVREQLKSKMLESALVERSGRSSAFQLTSGIQVVEEASPNNEMMDPLLSAAINKQQGLKPLVMVGALSASSAAAFSTLQVLYKALSLGADLSHGLISSLVLLLQRYSDVLTTGEMTAGRDIYDPMLERLACTLALFSQHTGGALVLLAANAVPAIVAAARAFSSQFGCFFALQATCNLLDAATTSGIGNNGQLLHLASVGAQLATTMLMRWRTSSSWLAALGCWHLLRSGMRASPALNASIAQYLAHALQQQGTNIAEELRTATSELEQAARNARSLQALVCIATVREILSCAATSGEALVVLLQGSATEVAQFVEATAACLDRARAVALHSTPLVDDQELVELELARCEELYVAISKLQDSGREIPGGAVLRWPAIDPSQLQFDLEQVCTCVDARMWSTRAASAEQTATSLEGWLGSWWLLEPVDPTWLHLMQCGVAELYDNPTVQFCELAKAAVLEARQDRKRQRV